MKRFAENDGSHSDGAAPDGAAPDGAAPGGAAPDGAMIAADRWQARLALAFADDHGVSRMVERSHYGPLRVQKPLYPEGADICHAIVVHPPGGVVGGDHLSITASVGDRASAFITTPGAAKWYKANGRVSEQDVRLDAGAGACLEWLPQETIFFDAAHVRLNHAVTLTGDAAYIGGEIFCFGRTASGERFHRGAIEQTTSIRRDGRLIWYEQGAITGGLEDPAGAMRSPLGLAGRTVCATLIAAGKALVPSAIAALRGDLAAIADTDTADGRKAMSGVTQMKSVIVVRYLGDSSEIAKQAMVRAWRQLRPEVCRREAAVPRIWNT